MSELILYYHPSCSYCAKVIRFMQDNGIAIATKNTRESSEIRQELIDIGGKSQVPCLVIDGKALYESDDIISWLQQHWSEQ